jgi:acetyl-CoA C-acetyltransferase
MKPDDTPILVGAAQVTQRWDGAGMPDHPLALMARASRAAFADSGAATLAASVDWLAVVNTITWSYADAPTELASLLGIAPERRTYTTIGGNSPQHLVHRAAEALAGGRAKAVLLAGGEAGDALAQARKLGRHFEEWPPRAEPIGTDGELRLGISVVEQAHDLFLPSAMYPLIETAIRARSRRSPDAHREFLGKLFERFSAVAARHPNAWFRERRSATEIATPSRDNRYVGYPYTKLMNAIMAVDQAAALVLTTEAHAQRLGIDPSRWVYPMGGADLNDVWHVTERPALDRSPAIRTAGERAMRRAGVEVSDLTAFDLYSCFPAAVELATDALEIPDDDPRDLTLTGGLPYFGGPGNNYSMHAIATAVDRIRANRSERVLVSGLGWYATKHSVGIYGSERGRVGWSEPLDERAAQAAIDATARAAPLEHAEGTGRIEAFVIRHGKDGAAVDGTALVRMESGDRALAKIDAETAELESLEGGELVGRRGQVRPDAAGSVDRVRIA